MKFALVFAATAAALSMASVASATTLYSNNFDAENGGATALNYTGFSGLTVTGGTVDVVKSGDFGIACAGGSGSCVDLDGSTRTDGTITTGFYSFNAGERVTFSFDLSGNQRLGGSDDFSAGFSFGAATLLSTYDLGGTWGPATVFTNVTTSSVNTSSSLSGNAFRNYSISFQAGQSGTVSAHLSSINSNDNVGAVADNLVLDLAGRGGVPEPATWGMMIIGFGAAGSMIRRRKAALTAA